MVNSDYQIVTLREMPISNIIVLYLYQSDSLSIPL